MRDVTIQIESITAYSSSKHFDEDFQKGEKPDEHDRRRWREKAHVDDEGRVFIPGVSFKMALDEAAGKKNEKIKGKGNQTYTGLFRSGVSAMGDVYLGVRIDDLKAISLYVSSTGERAGGGGKRVTRWFPFVPSWKGTLEMRVFDDSIPETVFEKFFADAGIVAGVGRGRPSTGCPVGNGRFKPVSFSWS